jgi:hypothetical protein
VATIGVKLDDAVGIRRWEKGSRSGFSSAGGGAGASVQKTAALDSGGARMGGSMCSLRWTTSRRCGS